MFSTWKYDAETKEVQQLRSAFDPVTARSSQHQACNHCHAKKLKCSGEKGGCDRCTANQIVCEYSRSGSRSSKRGKRSARQSMDSDRGDTSPCSSVGKSSAKSSSRRSGGVSSSKLPRASAHLSPDNSGSKSRSKRHSNSNSSCLSQLGPALLSPEDGFDLASLSIGAPDIVGTTIDGYGSVAAFSSPELQSTDDYYYQGAGGWQAGNASAVYACTSAGLDPTYLSTAGPSYTNDPYYPDYAAYTQYQQPDAQYWSQQR